MSNSTYGTDGLLATTLKRYAPRLEDNVFSSKPLLWATGAIVNEDGGEKLVEPLIYAEAPNAGSYSGTDVFATAANTGISAAEYDWRQYYGLVHFTGIELAKNQGRAKLLSLMEARMQQIELTIAENIDEMLFGDGSGNSTKDFIGLAAIISATDPSWGDLGGIDRTANAYWRAKTKTSTVAHTLALADMANVYNSASEGNDHPTNIFTTQTAFEAYEALLTPNLRFQDAEMGDAGFQNLMYKGAPITFDEYADVASSTEADAPMWFVNFKYIKLKTLSGVWFKPSDMLQPTNQDTFYKHLLCYGNLITTNASRQGVLYNLHA